MRSMTLAAAAALLLAIALAPAPASACPGRMTSSFDPPAGGLLYEGGEVTVRGRAAYRLANAGELRLWSTDHQIPLRVEIGPGVRVRLIPGAPLAVGTQYHLVAASDAHPGWTAPLGAGSPWWTGAARDRRAELRSLLARLLAFGLVPFALGYVATRTIIIRRRRRVIRDL